MKNFYGWIIVAVGACIMGTAVGACPSPAG